MKRLSLSRIVGAALIVVGTGVGMQACGYLVGEWGGGTSPATVRDSLIFSHYKHVVEEETDCGDCHGEIADSESIAKGRQLPPEKACMECHEKEDNCKMCHANPKSPRTHVDIRMPGIRFSHKAHLARKLPDGKKADCFTCHAGVKESKKVSQDRRPAMFNTCGQCHRKDFRREDCRRCHTVLPETGAAPTTVYDHTGDWMRRHGPAARGSETVCGHCHKPATCDECHGRAKIAVPPSRLNLANQDRNYQHRGDFFTRHRVEAKLDSKQCLTCHDRSNCSDCHQRMGVFATERGKGNPHPAEWLGPAGAAFHGQAARRNPLACATCHDQGAASNCVICHKVGAAGGSPHPPGWSSNQAKSAPGCAPCH